MPSNGPIFQDHHDIEQQTFRNSRLLKMLSDSGLYGIHAQENRLFLPSDPLFADTIRISPHSGGPIADYQIGIRAQLQDLEQTADGRAAIAGDPEALDRITNRVELLRDTMKVGLVNGDLHTNAPFGMTADDIRPSVQFFFRTWTATASSMPSRSMHSSSCRSPNWDGWRSPIRNHG